MSILYPEKKGKGRKTKSLSIKKATEQLGPRDFFKAYDPSLVAGSSKGYCIPYVNDGETHDQWLGRVQNGYERFLAPLRVKVTKEYLDICMDALGSCLGTF